MFCKIADFYIEVKNDLPYLEDICRDYLCEEPSHIDFTVKLEPEDVKREIELAKENGMVNPSGVMCAGLALYRKICNEVLSRDAFLMHGVAVDYNDCGYIFTAESGTGKTTHVRLWKKVFGEENVTIVNGDKPIIRFIDGKVYAYGTPWNGKEHYGINSRVEVKKLCFVARGEENGIRKISIKEAVPRIFTQIMLVDSVDLGRQLELTNDFLEKVDIYLLHCNMDPEAATVAYNGMKENV